MIDYFQAFWLAAIQGLTEFLPVSSSGHLILIPSLFGWPDQGLAFDVAVHMGSLIAVLVYFKKDITLVFKDWLRSMTSGVVTVHARLAWSIAFASVLIALVGVTLESLISTILRNPVSIAIATIVFAIVLWLADKLGKRQRKLEEMSWVDGLVISVAQVLALIPGTSRSGVTISAGLMMGLTRQAAARYSFLMAIPVIAMAGIWQVLKMLTSPLPVQWSVIIFGTFVAGGIAFVCIHYFLHYLERYSMAPFVIYRLILGVIILLVLM